MKESNNLILFHLEQHVCADFISPIFFQQYTPPPQLNLYLKMEKNNNPTQTKKENHTQWQWILYLNHKGMLNSNQETKLS